MQIRVEFRLITVLIDIIFVLFSVCHLLRPDNYGLFICKSSYCFQRILAIAILSVHLSVRPSVCHTGGSVKNSAS